MAEKSSGVLGQGYGQFSDAFVAELLQKKVLQPDSGHLLRGRKNSPWHDTIHLLKLYRKAYWAITNDIEMLASLHNDSVAPAPFVKLEEYKKVLHDVLQANIDVESIQKDQSDTLDRVKSLTFSLQLMEDMVKALYQIRNYPIFGETYFQILYYSYFAEINGQALINKRTPGYYTIVDYAQQENVEISYSKKSFYRFRDDALTLYDSALWMLTSRETVYLFLKMFEKMKN